MGAREREREAQRGNENRSTAFHYNPDLAMWQTCETQPRTPPGFLRIFKRKTDNTILLERLTVTHLAARRGLVTRNAPQLLIEDQKETWPHPAPTGTYSCESLKSASFPLHAHRVGNVTINTHASEVSVAKTTPCKSLTLGSTSRR